MRITIETDEPSQGLKTFDLSTPAQSGGAAQANSAQNRATAPDERMHLNAGRAPTFASLARVAGAPRLEAVQSPHRGAAVTDAGPAPQAVQRAARAAEEPPAGGGKGKAGPKRK
ncbi:hypothetical protein OKW43_007839 [Paraburkholderia sp. WC7.3g]|uniref:Uncharacterized protein n=1 Tax=Paraburkholderia podalyriae TaxID=1938811 RepID=A0ABR7PYF1_9BURK|nr:hypothetical protein [Paraburkholderia podalyriae]MBC8751310.1 hypothetical protein [Paraburkholderia podalyriae]